MEEQKLDLAIGGQALIEGVMIRSPNVISIAVRKPDGTIVTKKDPFRSLAAKIKILKFPLLRGIINLFEMIVIGMKALDFSVKESMEEEIETSKETHGETNFKKFLSVLSFTLSIVLSLAFAIALFKFLPLFITTQLEKFFPILKQNYFLFNIIDGLLRIAIFFFYIGILSLFPTFRRVFEYHGAEHKAVFTYEKNVELNITNVAKESPRHPRCGTSFLMVVFIVSIILFSLLPRLPRFFPNLGLRLLIIPLIAAVGYEILKWSAKYRNHWLIKLVTVPGLFTQKITTKEPDEKQMEVAIEALKGALELETRAHQGLKQEKIEAEKIETAA